MRRNSEHTPGRASGAGPGWKGAIARPAVRANKAVHKATRGLYNHLHLNILLQGESEVKRTASILKSAAPFMALIAVALMAGAAFGAEGGFANATGAHAAQAGTMQAATTAATGSTLPWWAWPTILFVVTFFLGIAAVLAGVGGGVLFVPIVSGFFPFHMDFVRGAGLLVALAGAVAAGPGLLKKGMADLRLSLPVGLLASMGAIVGAMVGLAVPANIVQTALGALILFIVAIMATAKKSDYPVVPKADALSMALRINGIYHDEASDKNIDWKIHRTPMGLFTFIFIGFLAGMFGLGAGWANVPVLNLMMGAPLKVSVATSKFLLSITDTSAAWVYINQGAVLPMIVVPSMIGIMLGSLVGVKLLAKAKPVFIKRMVIGLLLFAGLKAIEKGLGFSLHIWIL